MNHQPFETWLLDEKPLSAAERHELESHLRTCRTCSVLAETGLALRSAKVVSPAAGFTLRFQQRLARHKVAERRRRLWGLIVLLLSGVGLLAWLAAPYIYTFASAPVEWLAAGIGYFIFFFTSIQAFSEALTVFARVLPGFIPPYAWMVILSAAAGLGLAWTVSIWRLSDQSQGVTI
jgi:hypothetical protein